jgi:NADH:ubiquinone oxidoreductase subunit 6 (subunit J)
MNTQLAIVGRRINLAPRAHRRCLVALIYLIFTVLIVAGSWFSRYIGLFDAAGCVFAVVGVVYLLILYLVGEARQASDEREKRRWDQARARAYPCLGFVVWLALFTWSFHSKANATLHPELHGILQQLPYSILMAAGILYMTLPQAILLWTEPDMDSSAQFASRPTEVRG